MRAVLILEGRQTSEALMISAVGYSRIHQRQVGRQGYTPGAVYADGDVHGVLQLLWMLDCLCARWSTSYTTGNRQEGFYCCVVQYTSTPYSACTIICGPSQRPQPSCAEIARRATCCSSRGAKETLDSTQPYFFSVVGRRCANRASLGVDVGDSYSMRDDAQARLVLSDAGSDAHRFGARSLTTLHQQQRDEPGSVPRST